MSQARTITFPALRMEIGPDATTLWLDRPQVGNAINVAMLSSLGKALGMVEDEADILPGVVIVRGTGGNLSKGIDLADFPADKAPDVHGFHKWERLIVQLERLPKATLVVMEGDCIGGGLQLALACDLRIAVEGARLSLPEVRQGFIPGMATWRLAKLIGLARARRVVLTGEVLDAREADRLALVEGVVSAAELDARIAALIAQVSPVQQPAWALARRLLMESYEFSYEEAVGHLLAAQHRAVSSPAFLALLKERQA